MDIGKFKSSRGKLIVWILVPPLLIVGVGLSSYALQRQAEWRLNRTKRFAEVLPRLVRAQREADALFEEFTHSETGTVKTEDELISFLQSAAQKTGFTIDLLKVERTTSAQNASLPVLTANVKGFGMFLTVESFLKDVTSSQHLLSENSLQLTQESSSYDASVCRANITFELVLFDALKTAKGGVR